MTRLVAIALFVFGAVAAITAYDTAPTYERTASMDGER